MKSIVLTAPILRIVLITGIISFTIIVHPQNMAVDTMSHQGDAGITLSSSLNNY